MTTAVYDTIGRTYDRTRKADRRILDGLLGRLGLGAGARVLDVGCGSGNYAVALCERGLDVVGVDVSEQMLSFARAKSAVVAWQCADARVLPFADRAFDGAISVFATHHIADLDAALAEVARVLRPDGRVVLFTATPAQMRGFWLNHYMPGVVAVSACAMLEADALAAKLESAGLASVACTPFVVDETLEDWFFHCGKLRPELYLDPAVRAGISTFALSEGSEELARGLRALAADIRSGAIQRVIRDYESDRGDCLFVTAEKRRAPEERR